MKHILLPTDFSENSWNAIVYAIHFYEKMDCHFYLLHVDKASANNTTPSVYGVSTGVLNDTYITNAKEHLKQFIKRISQQFPRNNSHKFFTLSDTGSFIETIRRHIYERKIDTIVMGTKGATGLKKLLIGSNAGDVITKVKCTTLIIPENAIYTPIKEIAFPTDYSLSYELGHLQPIAEILERYQSALSVVHISKKNDLLSITQQRNKDLLEEYFTPYTKSFHQLTNSKIEEAIQSFIASRNTTIIAMVAKNLNYFQQILFHSKIKNISYHTDIPFLVMHDT
ncbi:universal stress protein [Mariniflexile sp. AS56]|uniref:universal stress protein n=1 Tax=Mariniflexile sp. AS56 TaxID=3063957 RepID=UPI0026ECF7C2|nr:universal stress protein [Mariniflexile sp. AS56]MDO7171108.1 universal stress protein [Mariniflexile sp. AS56]